MKSKFLQLTPVQKNTLPIITTKHEADNRVDSTVSVNHKVGYTKVYLETTRERGRTVLILYD